MVAQYEALTWHILRLSACMSKAHSLPQGRQAGLGILLSLLTIVEQEEKLYLTLDVMCYLGGTLGMDKCDQKSNRVSFHDISLNACPKLG